MKPPVTVIGGGAAGILAAYRAATLGAKVTLFEKTDRLGTKITISGGGKCNITHDGPITQVLKAFRNNEAEFIRPACHRFPNTKIVGMLTHRGLRVYTREDGRIFPVDQNAKDVVRILTSYLQDAEVEVRLETPISAILAQNGVATGIQTADGPIESSHVILCTGGSSYPKSGTTGDGYSWAAALGHTVVPIRAALAPMDLRPGRVQATPGVALRDVVTRAALANGKIIAKWRGDLLFTHHGVSGPCALGISREVADNWAHGPIRIEVDLLPDSHLDQVQSSLADIKSRHSNRLVAAYLETLAPKSVVPFLLQSAGIDDQAKFQSTAKKQLNILAIVLKSWRIGEVADVVLDKGEVVSGGVSLDEVDPATMRSHVVAGLYLAGEVLDIAGPVGGYNLQAAWATGWVAGESAATDWLS
ncbi:MAG: aminoacetone oxidase family FAD-binding enzyme [Armatimonadetes bacterium]|nr:aminoacetone oxidase family FAD-binding enzyme [Armatimonadota bacterium]MBX3109495.1 aminoacetone oxidase family FAD-binding enzyme [Fimbriimonadaceae bacterium]